MSMEPYFLPALAFSGFETERNSIGFFFGASLVLWGGGSKKFAWETRMAIRRIDTDTLTYWHVGDERRGGRDVDARVAVMQYE